MAKANGSGHRVIPEIDRKPAKATLRIPESDDAMREVGACLDAARHELKWTLDELAGKLPPPPHAKTRDPRQVQRWMEGKERVQIDVVFAVPELREPFVIELAKLAQLLVEETVTIRRKA
jgi:hypothetical protein